MTVLDSSGVIDFLLGDGAASDVEALLTRESSVAAPDVLVFEVLAVLRRAVLRGSLEAGRGESAIADLDDLPIELFPSLPLCRRSWELRANLTAADALFVALAERLGEPLATKDTGLAASATTLVGVQVVPLGDHA